MLNILNRVMTVAGYEVPPAQPITDSQESSKANEKNEEDQTEEETTKEENSLIIVLEKARAMYIEKGLKGNISITRSFTIFYILQFLCLDSLL